MNEMDYKKLPMGKVFKVDALGKKGLSLKGYKMVAPTMFFQREGEQLFKCSFKEKGNNFSKKRGLSCPHEQLPHEKRINLPWQTNS
jgi:hypothetical protein